MKLNSYHVILMLSDAVANIARANWEHSISSLDDIEYALKKIDRAKELLLAIKREGV